MDASGERWLSRMEEQSRQPRLWKVCVGCSLLNVTFLQSAQVMVWQVEGKFDADVYADWMVSTVPHSTAVSGKLPTKEGMRDSPSARLPRRRPKQGWNGVCQCSLAVGWILPGWAFWNQFNWRDLVSAFPGLADFSPKLPRPFCLLHYSHFHFFGEEYCVQSLVSA